MVFEVSLPWKKQLTTANTAEKQELMRHFPHHPSGDYEERAGTKDFRRVRRGWTEVLRVIRERGPLTEGQMLDLILKHQGFDAFLNGDDRISARVIDAAAPRLGF